MWRAWLTCRPVLRTVQRAADCSSRRTLTDTTRPRSGMAATAVDPKSRANIRPSTNQKWEVMDGNQAAAYVAYAMSDISFIYPISPATSMGEHMDKWAAMGKKNVIGQVVDVNMMQSEAGAAGALHGATAAGAMSSTFTASQGLLLMIPNMYLLAGELMPTVFHVSARTVSSHALSIFNDHSDVMATRQTGFAMLCSSSVQEVMDLGLAAHLASVKTRIPFLHFFDGFRTSAEASKIRVIPYEDMLQLYPHQLIKENLHDFALNPCMPMVRGTGQRPDIFFQNSVACHKYYEACPSLTKETLEEIGILTGRHYKLYEYHGSPTAERVAVCMGSAAKTLMEAADYLNKQGENVGVVNVHLYRPWSAKDFLESMPPSVKKIAVLDRTREEGASGMPLFLDVNVTYSDRGEHKLITGAQYGLASKEFTPAMAKAVFDNLNSESPKMRYVIGIEDDVTHTSLPYGKEFSPVPKGTTQVVFWGLGTDGTVGSAKSAINTIGLNTDLLTQGHFVYDSHKGGGVTISHLRFGPEEIKSQYNIASNADYISCAHPSYIYKFEMLEPLKDKGIFVLNSPWNTLEEMEKKLPAHVKNEIAQKNIQFYTLDAHKIAEQVGLGKKVNMIMLAAFYYLSGVLPEEQALNLLKTSVEKQYKHKGPKVIDMNNRAIDATIGNLIKVQYPESWNSTTEGGSRAADEHGLEKPEFISNIMDPVLALEGDKLPVSAFVPGGYQPIGTTMFEKRGIAPSIPVWKPDACTQCNYCAIVCPHAVVRPFLLDKSEVKAAPDGFESRKAKGGSEVGGYHYTIQISPFDCTGCEVCVESCPDDALYMAPFNEVAETYSPHWDYSISLPERGEIGDKYTVKGSQFQKPLLEFSGACAGCGETPYMKLATQLFGDRMVIANASGCSSVWGGTSTTIPFTKNKDGHGPAWGRSLFEDNAEYGFGMYLATKQRRLKLKQDVEVALAESKMSDRLRKALTDWIKFYTNPDMCNENSIKVEEIMKAEVDQLDDRLMDIFEHRNMLRTQSHWLVGGDGWAYDIGYGGLDHVFSRGENVNILVLDTEMYSNTGGQVSKATALSTVAKFATQGKRQEKKDLGLFAMQYDNVYVASVALGANMNQCVQAFKEAEHFPGTSLIIAYSPCIDWGIDMKNMMGEMKKAVDSGYWTLYRYDPRRVEKGLAPMQLDSRRLKGDLREYLDHQNRFQQLNRAAPELAESLHKKFGSVVQTRHDKYKKLAMDEYEMLEHLKAQLGEETSSEKVLVLYGSETGNAEALAGVFANELKRRGIRPKCMAMDDFDFDELPNQDQVFCLVSTCGQGEFPANCQIFRDSLMDEKLPSDFLQNIKFTVFGLGDSSYVYYNETAKRFFNRFKELGAKVVMDIGLGDDKDEERYETVWNEWLPELWNELGTDPPIAELLPPSYHVAVDDHGTTAASPDTIIPMGTKLVPLYKNVVLTPPDYPRDIRHYEFDLKGQGMPYSVGDCLGVYAHNDKEKVYEWLDKFGMSPKAVIHLEDLQGRKDPLPSTVSAGQLFTEVLDIFGRPSRRFYETLEIAATDEAEKAELAHLLSKEGKPDMQKLKDETVNHAELMTKFPSSKLSIEYLIDHIPRIKPRLYSIASSSEMYEDTLHLCVVKDDWTTPSGVYHTGLCSTYLSKQGVDSPSLVASKMNAAGINYPDTESFPSVMVALGTGIAPMRAMVQNREVARSRGETVGPMALFFGARHKRTDYTYGDEFEDYEARGIITLLSNAFSRDQEHKIYVQHRLKENPELIYDFLWKQKGFFYLCGPAGNVPPSVRAAVCEAFVKCGGHTPEEADKMVTQMQIEGRYNVEAW